MHLFVRYGQWELVCRSLFTTNNHVIAILAEYHPFCLQSTCRPNPWTLTPKPDQVDAIMQYHLGTQRIRDPLGVDRSTNW